ncbi:MAG: 13E12 repeat family protein [Actinomycetota bacterium]|nr:13E12 repeat family protein [Actinomycetota bacterium]
MTDSFAAATRALAELPCAPESIGSASDAELTDLIAMASEHRRLADVHLTVLAGEVARRSAPELGHDGLAQRLGHRTPEKMIQAITGSTARAAVQAVRIGGLLETHPWLARVTAALSAGSISSDHAEAIMRGLGRPSEDISSSALAAAAEELTVEAVSIDADLLFKRAQFERDEIDAAGVTDRARAAHAARELKVMTLRDGRVRLSWMLDAIQGSVLKTVFDRATSPKRGGPRFVTEQAQRQKIADDPRSVEQLASDVFFHLITAGAEVDPSHLLGTGAPGVRVTVTERQLRARTGRGRLGRRAVPIETVERLACTNGTITIAFDDLGHPLDVGREQRLFTTKQRLALEVRDGGCMWGERCDRPPSWCEAHHIEYWARDGGRTDVADGLLLCKHHHLLLHDHHWEIERRGPGGTEFWLVPPPTHPEGERRLVSLSAVLHDLFAVS